MHAVRTLMKMKQLEAARSRLASLQTRETELQAEIDAAEDISPELEQSVNEVADQIEELQETIDTLQGDLDGLDEAMAAAVTQIDEESADGEMRSVRRAARPAPVESAGFRCRSGCFRDRRSRDAFYARSEVKGFLSRLRSMVGGQKRGVTGAELTIPTDVLDVLRDNLNRYSKLISHVRLRSVRGKARQNIIGDVPEGVWMEMSGALNELTFAINEIETDGYKVGGVIILDNYILQDNDINLGEEVMYMLGQSIGLALDKAIVYGKGGKMPIGIVTRLAETAEPSYWTENRAPWTDLHTSNVLKLDLSSGSGESFFRTLLAALAKANPKLSASGRPVWIMNEATRVDLMIKALAFNSAAALVSGMDYTMPVLGGEIVTEEFMADHEIAGGYLDTYLLAERDGGSFGYSDLPMYIQDKTVFKGTARYDGQPVRGESFVAVNYANVEPTTAMSFATDYAGDGLNALIVTAAAGTASGDTVLTVAGAKESSPTLKYAAKALPNGIAAGDTVGKDFAALTSGTTQITAATGTPIVVVEVDASNRVISCGTVTAVAKA